ALPAPGHMGGSGGRAPATPVEEVLCGLFAEVLGRDQVGVEESFFELGGDSIMSMLLVSGARRAGLVVTARQVFERQTPAALAAVAGAVGDGVALGGGDSGVGEVPLTPVMRELLERAGPDRLGQVSQSMLVVTPAGLNVAILTDAVQALVDHHDILRARLEPVDQEWRLVVPETAAVAPWVHQVQASVGDLKQLVDEQTRSAVSRLDPQAGVMAQAVWFDTGPDTPGRLLLIIDHLVVDAVSLRILLPDLMRAYTELAAGRPAALEPVPTSFRQWARALSAQAGSEERLAELPEWIQLLQGLDPALTARPPHPSRDVGATMRKASVRVPTATTTTLLTTIPAAFHAGIDDILLTALVLATAEWGRRRGETAGDGILIDVEGHGRIPSAEGVDLSRTVGWFTSAHPVRLDPGTTDFSEVRAGGPAAGGAVKRIKEQLRAVPGDGLGYGLLRYLNPETAPTLAALPTAQIGFNYLGRFATEKAVQRAQKDWTPASEGGSGGGLDGEIPMAHALEAVGVVHDSAAGPQLTLTLAWPGHLLDKEAVQDLVDGWAAMLNGVATHTTAAGSGGHTPSDFSLITLDQSQIDALENELADRGGAR
ncbi:condensation domain-containing protein, partial [Streptomyces sp. NPDC002889]|uniref:condensation domain-containing protein n=1 Tax=Streptomyces sp. NPDC002889 TaxID=3364669 RepID=UPI0036A06CCF